MRLNIFSVHFKNVALLQAQYESILKYKEDYDINYIVMISASDKFEQHNLIEYCKKNKINYLFDENFINSLFPKNSKQNYDSHPIMLNFYIKQLNLNKNDVCLLIDSDVFFIKSFSNIIDLYNKDGYIYTVQFDYNKTYFNVDIKRVDPCFIMAPYSIFFKSDFNPKTYDISKKKYHGDVGSKLVFNDFFKRSPNLKFEYYGLDNRKSIKSQDGTEFRPNCEIGNGFMLHLVSGSWGNNRLSLKDIEKIIMKAVNI